MFEIENNHSPNYLADLSKLPLRKGLRSSTYSHFLGYFPIVLMLNLHFPTVDPFYKIIIPPISPLLLFCFHFVKPSKSYCSNSSNRALLNKVESALYKWFNWIRLDLIWLACTNAYQQLTSNLSIACDSRCQSSFLGLKNKNRIIQLKWLIDLFVYYEFTKLKL